MLHDIYASSRTKYYEIDTKQLVLFFDEKPILGFYFFKYLAFSLILDYLSRKQGFYNSVMTTNWCETEAKKLTSKGDKFEDKTNVEELTSLFKKTFGIDEQILHHFNDFFVKIGMKRF